MSETDLAAGAAAAACSSLGVRESEMYFFPFLDKLFYYPALLSLA